MKTYPYRASKLKSTVFFWPQFHGRKNQFLETAKKVVSCDLFIKIIIIIHNWRASEASETLSGLFN